jgi:hypothetical protein
VVVVVDDGGAFVSLSTNDCDRILSLGVIGVHGLI